VNFFPLLAILFLSLPLIEIYFMIQIGSVIGAGWTVLAIISTAVLGAALIRRQGFGVYMRMNSSLEKGEIPAMEMLEGLALLVSGLMLLTPGFITDATGFLLLVPPLRQWLVLNLLKRHFIQQVDVTGTQTKYTHSELGQRKGPIDGDYRRIDE
jgi:UPF0716 protein FxsA